MAKVLVCTQCGYVGRPRYAAKGSLGVEILLWFFFLLPGIIYSVWRLSSKANSCPQCKGSSLIPLTSPNAKKILENTGQSPADYEKLSEEETKKDIEKGKRRTLLIALVIISFIGFTVLMSVVGS